MIEPLTKRQKEFLTYIEEYNAKHGYAPTLEEMKHHFHLRSVATVHKHLSHLERKGYIRRNWNQSRSIQFESTPDQANITDVPLLGLVAAGTPIEAISSPDSIAIPADMLGRRETFVLQVKGQSMIDEQIRDGDFIVVESRDTAENGDVVVALVNNEETTVKKFYREPPDHIRLQPANETMEPIIVPAEQVKVQGVVMGILRKFR